MHWHDPPKRLACVWTNLLYFCISTLKYFSISKCACFDHSVHFQNVQKPRLKTSGWRSWDQDLCLRRNGWLLDRSCNCGGSHCSLDYDDYDSAHSISWIVNRSITDHPSTDGRIPWLFLASCNVFIPPLYLKGSGYSDWTVANIARSACAKVSVLSPSSQPSSESPKSIIFSWFWPQGCSQRWLVAGANFLCWEGGTVIRWLAWCWSWCRFWLREDQTFSLLLMLIGRDRFSNQWGKFSRGGAHVRWEIWPGGWKVGDGEGDAQKKAKTKEKQKQNKHKNKRKTTTKEKQQQKKNNNKRKTTTTNREQLIITSTSNNNNNKKSQQTNLTSKLQIGRWWKRCTEKAKTNYNKNNNISVFVRYC